MAALETDTEKAPSLRELARRAGVSPAAPYRHFTDLAALNRAVAAEGFRRFRRALDGARDDSQPAREQLVAMAEAYVRFALETPGLFRLMFSAGIGGDSDAELHAAGQEAYGRLARVAGRVAPDAPGEAALAAWAFVHGLAMLVLDKQLPGATPDGTGALVRRLARRWQPPSATG